MVVRYRVSGWLISLMGHAAIVGAAILMMTDLRLANQPEPFRWQVSVTQPPAPQSAEVPSPPEPNPAPAQKITDPPKPVRKPPTPTDRRVEQMQHVTQAVQAVTPVTHQEVRKVEPVVHQERARAEAMQSEASIMREMESVNRSAETRLVSASAVSAPVTESVVTQSQQAVADASSVVTHEVVERADSPVTEQTAISETAVTTLPAQVHESGPVPLETAEVQQRPLTESSLSRPAIESVPVETATVQTPAIESSVAQQTPRTPIQHASIQNPAVQSMPAAKADYSWLLEALWSRVEQLKRYPYLARTNRWEGLVVLRAVINQDGQLLDLKVAESSGHAVLDQDAMDVMRRSCPLHLKHPLGKPQVELRVPISYKLR